MADVSMWQVVLEPYVALIGNVGAFAAVLFFLSPLTSVPSRKD